MAASGRKRTLADVSYRPEADGEQIPVVCIESGFPESDKR